MRGFLIFLLIAKATSNRLGYGYESRGQVAAFGNTGGGVSDNIGTAVEQFNTNANVLGVADAFGSGLGGLDSSNSDVNNFISNNNIVNNNNDNSEFNAHTAAIANIGAGNGYSKGQHDGQPVDAEYSKEFYSYRPPEEDNYSGYNDAGELGAVRKSLRVIFIRAPENQALTNAALQLAKQASEDRTAIYVLTKQTDAAELANRLQTIKSSHNANKPEVHFVKYRTPEDAVRAQQAIQAQYDALGGSTLSSNEGVAPVLNFATSNVVGGTSGGSGVGGEAAYLPPILF